MADVRERLLRWRVGSEAAERRSRAARGVEEPCMHGTFMCENREIPFSPVVHGQGRRAAQGRLRPQA